MIRSRSWPGLCLLAALLAGGCAEPRPNILLISLDTLRADSLGCYGYERDTSPFLDELAGRGIRFENAFVNTLATTPSHVSMLSSQYQESHGVLYDSRREEGTEAVSIPASIPLLPEVLRRAGYRTLGVTDGGNFAGRHGFDRGFDEFDGEKAKGVVKGIRRLLTMLDRHAEVTEPIFLLYHTYEIHAPYDPPAPYDTMFGTSESDFRPAAHRLRAIIDTAGHELSASDFERIRLLYDGGIRFTDEAMRSLFSELDKRRFFDGDHLVVVTSDHGEEFGERGGVLHRGLLYDEFLQVPLIVSGRRVAAATVRNELVSSVDIAPTILAYAGVEAPESMQGADLLGRTPPPTERQYVVAQFRNRRYAIRTPEWKFIASGVPELYQLSSDPEERHNVAMENLDRVAEFEGLLARWRAGQEGRRPEPAEAVELGPEELEQMRALGYVN